MLDIKLSTLVATYVRSFTSSADVRDLHHKIEQIWSTERPLLVCQSVRSGLDIALSTLKWPPGSEILMSAVTIPEMVRIVEVHGLVPLPVDVDPHSLASDIDQIKSRFSSRTRAILVAHLFGSRLDLSVMSHFARQHGIQLWEDVAQFDGWLSRSVRGFDSNALFEQLRKQPCGSLVDLLHRRLNTPDRKWLLQKTELAEEYRRRLPSHVLLGSSTAFPSDWVMPAMSRDPDLLIDRLKSMGFDATRKASQLRTIPAPIQNPECTTVSTEKWVSRFVFLPLHPALTTNHIAVIASVVSSVENESVSR